MDAQRRADAIARSTRGLADPPLRVSYLVDVLLTVDVAELARALDVLCGRAEQAEEPAREVLVALVDALNAPGMEGVVQLLREQAVGESLLALERLVRQPILAEGRRRAPSEPKKERLPDYGTGRPLTLGERKALARRPNRSMMEKLLLDPHPDVIRRLLRSPRLTEDDVVRLAARRPNRPEILVEIARSQTWIHRARVRLAVILNPDTPVEVAGPITGLLVRQELALVAEATHVSPAVRALCLEHAARRPPGESRGESAGDDPIQ
jgi:hypothetical protein